MPALRLDRAWDGGFAPEGVGGAASLEFDGPDLVLAWDLALAEGPSAPAAPPGFLDGLWEHDVVELFLAPAALPEGPPRYLELEAGVAGHWLALAFSDVRLRSAELSSLDARVEGTVADGRWLGRLRVPREAVVDVVGKPPWRGLACAVLGGRRSERAFLTSSRLRGERVDFHQPRAWPSLP